MAEDKTTSKTLNIDDLGIDEYPADARITLIMDAISEEALQLAELEKKKAAQTGVMEPVQQNDETDASGSSADIDFPYDYEYTMIMDSPLVEDYEQYLDFPESEETDETAEAEGEEADAEEAGTDDGEEQVLGLQEDDGYNINSDGEIENSKDEDEIIARIRERKKENLLRQKRFRRRFKIISITVVVLAATFFFSISSFFTITDIEVKGNDHYSSEEIINIGHASPGHNIIYHPGSQEIQEYLEQNPYIKSATITRKLPSTLVITVVERQQICAFKYDDDYLVMDEEGILLRKSRNKPKTTLIDGLVVSKIKLGQRIEVEDTELFNKTLDLLKTMKDSDMYFVKVTMSKYPDVRAYIYDTLSVKTEYDTLIENLENDHLHKVVEKLFEDGIKRGTITFGDDGTASFEPGL